MDVDRCVALHNRLYELGRTGANLSDGPESSPLVRRQSWFDLYGAAAETERARLALGSPSLVSFLEQAWACDDGDHNLFYFVSGLNTPSRLWLNHAVENEDASDIWHGSGRYLTLYAATNIASHPDGVVFDLATNRAIMQMSIFDSDMTMNGRQPWYPLERVLEAWLDMVACGKVEAVPEEEENTDTDRPLPRRLSTGDHPPWIMHPFSQQQLDETVAAFEQLAAAIEARMPEAELNTQQTVLQAPLLSEAAMDAAGLPDESGFARSFLRRARRPRFRFVAPGLELPTAETFAAPRQTFVPLRRLDSDGHTRPEDAKPEDSNGFFLAPILLFPAAATSANIAPECPFDWPYDKGQVDGCPAGLYLESVDRYGGTVYEDAARLVLPFGIGIHGCARTADGVCFGSETSGAANAQDTCSDLYQPGYVPFVEQHPALLGRILQAWTRQVESEQWAVDAEGVSGGMDKWREADTPLGWQSYVMPISW